MKLTISGSPVRLARHTERIWLPVVYDILIEHRKRGRIFDRHQSDETCNLCDRIALRVVPVPFVSDMDQRRNLA